MKRPFRIYDSKTKKNLPHRAYVHFKNVHIAALVQARWANVGTAEVTLEVISTEGAAYGQYKRGVHGITFYKLREEI